MKFIASLALLVSAVAASPIQARDTAKSFYLKTSGAANDAHNNLYVYAYHTGAGFNDAVLTSDTSKARAVTLNGTNAQFDLGTTFPWGFKMGANTNYASWEPVQINVGYGDEGFSVDGTSLQWSEQNGFGGWLVCDWYHNAPQLFWLYQYLPATIPSSCDKVDLTVEYTS